jgi:hypothetical protein
VVRPGHDDVVFIRTIRTGQSNFRSGTAVVTVIDQIVISGLNPSMFRQGF